MKHHIELIISIPVCGMGGASIVNDDLLPCCLAEDDYVEKTCNLFSPIREHDSVPVLGGRSVCLGFADKYIAFDCTSYEYDEISGFKSRGRYYDADDIQRLKIEGEFIIEPNG